MMMTLLGMALGGWMSGVIFDISGSYRAAFANGVAWNGLNLLIAIFLLFHSRLKHQSARRNVPTAIVSGARAYYLHGNDELTTYAEMMICRRVASTHLDVNSPDIRRATKSDEIYVIAPTVGARG